MSKSELINIPISRGECNFDKFNFPTESTGNTLGHGHFQGMGSRPYMEPWMMWPYYYGNSSSYSPSSLERSRPESALSSWWSNGKNWFDSNNWFRDDLHRTFGQIEKEMTNLKKHFGSLFFDDKTATSASSNRFSTEMVNYPSRPTSSLEYYTFMNPVRIDRDGNRFLSLVFDLCSFKPEEIRVTLYTQAKYIEVEASHHVKDAKEHDVRRSYSRKYFFPADLKIDATKLELKSFLTNEGQLFVESILPKLSLEEMRLERSHYPVNACPVKTEKKEF